MDKDDDLNWHCICLHYDRLSATTLLNLYDELSESVAYEKNFGLGLRIFVPHARQHGSYEAERLLVHPLSILRL